MSCQTFITTKTNKSSAAWIQRRHIRSTTNRDVADAANTCFEANPAEANTTAETAKRRLTSSREIGMTPTFAHRRHRSAVTQRSPDIHLVILFHPLPKHPHNSSPSGLVMHWVDMIYRDYSKSQLRAS